MAILEEFKPRAGKYFPSLRNLLDRWGEVLDRARMPAAPETDRNGNPKPDPMARFLREIDRI